MRTREIGESGLIVGVLSLGAWVIGDGSWWGGNDDSLSVRMIHCTLDQGLNWIDTAPVYSSGYNEEVVDHTLKGRRESAILSIKCGSQWRDANDIDRFERDGYEVYRNLSACSIRQDLEDSLRRLQTNYIDIYYTHWQTLEGGTPITEAMTELLKMRQEGKIRAIGASNVTTARPDEYLKYGKVNVVQEKFSLLGHRVEASLLPYCEEHKITLQAYLPLEQGLLAGRIIADYEIPEGSIHENEFWWMPEHRQFALQMLDGWSDLMGKYGCTLGNLVVAWMVVRNRHLNVLGDARKTEQMEENAKASELVLEQVNFERVTRDANAAIASAKQTRQFDINRKRAFIPANSRNGRRPLGAYP